jgi:MFS family permease
MGVLTAGGSAGGLVHVPLLAYLLGLVDWRTTWVIAGAITLVLGLPLLVLIVKSDPRELSLAPDGDPVAARPGADLGRAAAGGPLEATRWPEAFRSAPMWQLSLAYFVCGVTTASIAVHYVPWATAQGLSPATAALAFGVLSAINAAGVLIIGTLSDTMPRKTLLGIVYLIRAVAFILLVLLPGAWALWGFAVVGGMSWLATVPLTTSLTADVYGLKHLGTLGGLITLAHQIGGALAVYAFGLCFDLLGSYDLAFLVGAVLLVVAGVLSLSIRERAYSVRYAPVTAAPSAVTAAGAG